MSFYNGYYRARVTLGRREYNLLTTKDQWAAAAAVNAFHARVIELDPGCSSSSSSSSIVVNQLPAGVVLSDGEQLKVERQASAAIVARILVELGLQQQRKQEQSQGAADLQAALANLGDHSAQSQQQLLRLLQNLATKELPADAPVTEFALASTANYVRRRQGNPNGCRWPQRLIEIYAVARAQNSADRALDILDGTTDSPNIPGPSRLTTKRLVEEQTPESGPFTGISEERVAAFLAAVQAAGIPFNVFATLDGTELQVCVYLCTVTSSLGPSCLGPTPACACAAQCHHAHMPDAITFLDSRLCAPAGPAAAHAG